MTKADPIETTLPKPVSKPLYRLNRTFEENAASGPDFDGPFPAVPVTGVKEFFGFPVASRIGIAASLVLNRRWFETFSRLGFDILTYKTIRSQQKLAHPVPNWIFPDQATVEGGGPMALGPLPADPLSATAIGSIGMPSVAPEVWHDDIRACADALRDGQVLIVSVVGTAAEGVTREAFIDDFRTLAVEAVAAGAQVVEVNLSCPNVQKAEGELYLDLPFAAEILGCVRAAIGDVPLLVKIGAITDDAVMTALLTRLDPLVDGVVMINAPSREIEDADGQPAFGPARRTAGMMGGAVFDIGLDCVTRAVAVAKTEGLRLKILAVGGVTAPDRIKAYADAGAYAVLGASACAWDPYLAIRAKTAYPEL
ncbi:beta/alpha barrel domain-containing protein [Chachezhania sediminis]|uniref:hypothetical protein n=1 Tax=Chachezhania sediminis TaxID=2599291 RepID=UPI00131E8BF1|nr:hypothetical protein [Chachezhania sediminis]